MRSRSVIITLALAVLSAGTAFSADRWDPGQIDAVLKGAVQRGEIPGVVAMVATRDAVVYRGAFGKRDRGQGVEMTEDTIFRIFSMTKPITSVAAMQLVEQGKLALDEPVKKYLPAVGTAKVLEGFREGEPVLKPATTAITLRQLLTHTSGYAYGFTNKDLHDYLVKRGLPPIAAGDDGPLAFDPGTRWEYGTSTDTAGRLVEVISGMSLEDYFQKNIFRPLAMSDSSFNVPAGRFSRITSLHQRQADGSLRESPRTPPDPVTTFSGGGGLFSTAPDYVRFMQMLLRRGRSANGSLLQPEAVAVMTRNQIGDLQAGKLKTAMPEYANEVDFYPGITHKFGLGFLINPKNYEGGRSAGSLAWAGLANTYFWVDPERKLCAVILMQVLPFFDKDAVSLLRNFEHAVYATAPAPDSANANFQ